MLAALVLLGAAVIAGCGSQAPQVGDCSTADLKTGVDLFPEIVECGDAKATSKLVSEVKDESGCRFARLEIDDRFFCVQPIDADGKVVDMSPQPGDCTTGDPTARVSFVKPVACSDPEAKSVISRKVADVALCGADEMSTELAGDKYCLKGRQP